MWDWLKTRLAPIWTRAPREVGGEPLAFVSVTGAIGLVTWLKIGAAAVAASWLAFHAGHWFGDRDGYNRHRAKVAAEMAARNARIEDLNAALDEAHVALEAARDRQAVAVAASLRDITAETRAMCAAKCSMPRAASQSLEGIR